jgi:hypothetical protein
VRFTVGERWLGPFVRAEFLSDPSGMVVASATRKGPAMCWQCDHPGGTTDEYLDELYETIGEHGWAVQYVEDDRRPFAYTIGLSRLRLPELLVTGVSSRRAARLLNRVARMVVSGDPLAPGKQITLPAGPLVEAVYVTHPDAHLSFAVAIFGPGVTALQLVWVDERGRWPWAPDFDEGRGTQPVLGVRAARRIA